MSRFYFVASAYLSLLGVVTGLVAFLSLVGGHEWLVRSLAWPWFITIFPVFLAALIEAVAVARRFQYKLRLLPQPRVTGRFLQSAFTGCPHWIGALCLASLAVFVFVVATSETNRAEMSDGLSSEELPIVISTSIAFFALSAAILWSTSGRKRWAAA